MKTENSNLNIPNITVGDIVETLSALYSKVITDKLPLASIPTPFLWGPAGVGKSEAITQVAEKLSDITGKTTVITDVRLLLFSPVDLRGVPVADEQKKFSNWLMPKIFDMNPDSGFINILFLDELSAAPQSVQAAAYQICLDRKIGEHKLPENCIVIAAGNRTTDQSVSYKMPKALCNRLMHFNIEANYDSWHDWAITRGIDSRIIGYLAFDNRRLCVEPDSSDMAYPTPRSWSFVSNLIKWMPDDLSSMHALICACVGTDTAIEFETWLKNLEDLPSVKYVFRGVALRYPKTYDALLAFSASLISAVRENKDSITLTELENVCDYVSIFPADILMSFYKDLNAIEPVRLKLMKCPSSQKWLSQNKSFL